MLGVRTGGGLIGIDVDQSVCLEIVIPESLRKGIDKSYAIYVNKVMRCASYVNTKR